MLNTEIFQKYPPLQEIVGVIRFEISKAARPANEILVTETEFQKMFGISRRTAIRIRQSGLLKYSKIGGVIIYVLADILSFVDSNSIETFSSKNRIVPPKTRHKYD